MEIILGILVGFAFISVGFAACVIIWILDSLTENHSEPSAAFTLPKDDDDDHTPKAS